MTALRAVQNAGITLENVVVPHAFNVADGNSLRDTNKVLNVTRLSFAWPAAGPQAAAFDADRRYAVERQPFGRPIASFRLVQDQLVKKLGNVVACRVTTVRLARLEDRGLAKGGQSALAKALPGGNRTDGRRSSMNCSGFR